MADYSDWIRPIGNSLNRALDAQSDDGLTSMLRKAQFLADRSHQRNDGVGIVQSAHDEGRLWDLVKLLSSVPSSFAHVYDVVRITESMSVWLRTTDELLGMHSVSNTD